jgi:hypothetical protein
MPSKTTPTREQIEQQAAELAAQVDAFRQQDYQQQEEEWQRRAQAQEEFDRQLVASYSANKVEDDVQSARKALDAALATDPLVIALADYSAALRRRARLAFEASSADTRLGGPGFRQPPGPTELVGGLDEYVLRTAERLATEQVDAEMAELLARRDAAGLA